MKISSFAAVQAMNRTVRLRVSVSVISFVMGMNFRSDLNTLYVCCIMCVYVNDDNMIYDGIKSGKKTENISACQFHCCRKQILHKIATKGNVSNVKRARGE